MRYLRSVKVLWLPISMFSVFAHISRYADLVTLTFVQVPGLAVLVKSITTLVPILHGKVYCSVINNIEYEKCCSSF